MKFVEGRRRRSEPRGAAVGVRVATGRPGWEGIVTDPQVESARRGEVPARDKGVWLVRTGEGGDALREVYGGERRSAEVPHGC